MTRADAVKGARAVHAIARADPQAWMAKRPAFLTAATANKHVPDLRTQRIVTSLKRVGRGEDAIADLLEIDVKTLRKCYPGELGLLTDEERRLVHVPTDVTRRTVETMVAVGVKVDLIARVLGITLPTLYDHYRDELELGKAKVDVQIGGGLIKAGTLVCREVTDEDGNVHTMIDDKALKAAIFYAQTKMGWTKTQKHLHGQDPDADPMQVEVSAKSRLLEILAGVPEEVEAIEAGMKDVTPASPADEEAVQDDELDDWDI